MIEIGRCIVSRSVFEESFCCELSACKGQCCVEGESGAPLTDEECNIVENLIPDLEKVLRPEGMAVLREQGAWTIDSDGDKVTTLLNGAECAYTVFRDDGTALCGIETLYRSGSIDFQKPVSCHLYPVRIDRYEHFDALNYHRWQVCDPSLAACKTKGVPIFRSVKEALVRCYGQQWYDEAESVYEAHFASQKRNV